LRARRQRRRQERITMRTRLLFALAAAGLILAACNTVGGVGRDLSSAGRAVTETAEDVRR
jgi:entericidin B